ncbi:hypothetical protein ABZ816_40400 [Actinosynnema sp. NPDC047251]|uniref:hypothetical protein n=1 Tax=Saccharothrix espanaensis TaxID=103731 RepID=UPI0011DD9BC9|nr:hypothetical protein [Saccharothrix espanaensis]
MKGKKGLVVAFALAVVALSGGMAQATPTGSAGTASGSVGTLDTTQCTDLRNGRLCITITPVNQQGSIRVSYQKKSGTSFYGHLEWVNPAGRTFRSPDVTMSAGNTYAHTWPTWVGSGCNRGVVYNATDKESSFTPYNCV